MSQTVLQGGVVHLDALFRGPDGTLVDADALPEVDIIDPYGVHIADNLTPNHDSVGAYSIDWPVPGTATVGGYTVHWTGVIGGDPVSDDDVFTVVAPGSIVPVFADSDVCGVWATTADVCAPCNDYTFDPALLEAGLAVASDVLYQFTGRQWGGLCTDEVRPCGCGTGILWGAPAVARLGIGWAGVGGSGYRGPWGQGNRFLGGWCGCSTRSACGCGGLSELRLPGYPVVSIDHVLVDGVLLAADQYRLDDQRWLVRLGGKAWPCCQRQDLDDTEAGTFSVAYTYGQAPPPGGVRAAASLGCQLALACSEDDADQNACRLPERITSIVRQGVSMAVLDPMTLFPGGQTGLADVDLWLASIQVGRARREATVFLPGQGPTVRRPG